MSFNFTLFKFTFKNFIILEIVSDIMVSTSIFLIINARQSFISKNI